jgi:hypothetical protein
MAYIYFPKGHKQSGESPMARSYIFANRFTGYAMEECEEQLLIAYFSQIEKNIRPDAKWPSDFRAHFFDMGDGVAQAHLDGINSERRRNAKPEIAIIETYVGSYARNPDRPLKGKFRRHLRDKYLDLSPAEQTKWITLAEFNVSILPAPPAKLVRTDRHLTEPEVIRRNIALHRATQAPVNPPPIIVEAPPKEPSFIDRFNRVLSLAKGDDLIARMVEQLSPDLALRLAESGKITHEKATEMLLMRSLAVPV